MCSFTRGSDTVKKRSVSVELTWSRSGVRPLSVPLGPLGFLLIHLTAKGETPPVASSQSQWNCGYTLGTVNSATPNCPWVTGATRERNSSDQFTRDVWVVLFVFASSMGTLSFSGVADEVQKEEEPLCCRRWPRKSSFVECEALLNSVMLSQRFSTGGS